MECNQWLDKTTHGDDSLQSELVDGQDGVVDALPHGARQDARQLVDARSKPLARVMERAPVESQLQHALLTLARPEVVQRQLADLGGVLQRAAIC